MFDPESDGNVLNGLDVVFADDFEFDNGVDGDCLRSRDADDAGGCC